MSIFNFFRKNKIKAPIEENLYDILEDHYNFYFEPKEDEMLVIHSSDMDFHVDVLHIKANEKRNYQVLATIGMANYMMSNMSYKNIELIMILPEDYVLDYNDEKTMWPYRAIYHAATYSFYNNKQLSVAHTIDLSEEDKKISGYEASYLTWPDLLPINFFTTFIYNNTINILLLTTLTKEELELYRKMDPKDFFELYIENQNEKLFSIR